MRYTVTLTELDEVSGNPDAKVVRVTPHTGEALVSFGELVEDARLSATTPQARELWVNAIADLVHGWVHPWDDGAPMFYPMDA